MPLSDADWAQLALDNPGSGSPQAAMASAALGPRDSAPPAMPLKMIPQPVTRAMAPSNSLDQTITEQADHPYQSDQDRINLALDQASQSQGLDQYAPVAGQPVPSNVLPELSANFKGSDTPTVLRAVPRGTSGGGGGGASGVVGNLGQAENMELRANALEKIAGDREQQLGATENQRWSGQRDIASQQSLEALDRAKANVLKREGLVLPSPSQPSGLAMVANLLSFMPGVVGGLAKGLSGMYQQQAGAAASYGQSQLKQLDDNADAEEKLAAAYQAYGASESAAHTMALSDIHTLNTVAQAKALNDKGDTDASAKLLKSNASTIIESLKNQSALWAQNATTAKTNVETQKLRQEMDDSHHVAAADSLLYGQGKELTALDAEQLGAKLREASAKGTYVPALGAIAAQPLGEEGTKQVGAQAIWEKSLSDLKNAMANPFDRNNWTNANTAVTNMKATYPNLLGTSGRVSPAMEEFLSKSFPNDPAGVMTFLQGGYGRFGKALEETSALSKDALTKAYGLKYLDPDTGIQVKDPRTGGARSLKYSEYRKLKALRGGQ